MVLNIKDILGRNILVSGDNKERLNGAPKVVISSIFSSFSNTESYHSDIRENFTTSPMWYGAGGFFGRLIRLLLIACMYLIWLKFDIFYWRFFSQDNLSLRAVTTLTFLHLPAICWLDTASTNCCTVVIYCIPMMVIQTLVIFLAGNALFHVLFYLIDGYKSCCDDKNNN